MDDDPQKAPKKKQKQKCMSDKDAPFPTHPTTNTTHGNIM